jgi:hypothetical protein
VAKYVLVAGVVVVAAELHTVELGAVVGNSVDLEMDAAKIVAAVTQLDANYSYLIRACIDLAAACYKG